LQQKITLLLYMGASDFQV